MEFIKHVIGQETVYISKLEPVNSNYVLIGFKDSLPVLSSSIMESKPMLNAKTVKIEVGNKGEKYIMLNGKRIKILAKSELPKNSQIIKIATAVKKNKFQIIPSQLKNEYEKFNLPNLLPRRVPDKNIIMPQLSSTNPIENMVLKIPVSNSEPIKPNTTDKHSIAPDNINLKMVHTENTSGNGKAKKRLVLSKSVIENSAQSSQCGALDLTKSPTMKADKGVQTEIKTTCSIDIQTEPQDDFEALLKMDLSSILEDSNFMSPIAQKSIDENLDASIIDEAFSNCPKVYTPLTTFKNNNNNRTEETFFKELRAALQADDKGNMPIHVGVLTDNFKLVKRSCFILKILNQNVDILNDDDMTALQLAVLNSSSINIIHHLLQNDAQIGVCDSEGNTVLHYAVQQSRSEPLKLLLNYTLQQRMNIDQHNNEGLTPLMISCLNRDYDSVELLLDSDADPNVKDQISGRTALFHAAELYDVAMVELLLQFNACTKIKNFFGTSPHDAMYEIDDMPDAIKFIILGRTNKRKAVLDEYNIPSKFSRKSEKAKNRKVLKTYARLEKIQCP